MRKNDSQSENSVRVNACGDGDRSRDGPPGVTLALEFSRLSAEVIETSNPAEQHPLCKERQRERCLCWNIMERCLSEREKNKSSDNDGVAT
ncbi:uncharacterized [Tachysurus ichikawai]